MALREVHHFVGVLVVVLAILHCDEVGHIHQELGRSACAGEHARDNEHHVDKSAAEGLQIGRRGGVAADALGAADEPGVHRDARAVVGQARLVVLIDEVVLQQVKVAVGQLLAVELLDAVAEQTAVEAYEVRLRQLADKGGDVLVLHVGVGVILGARGRVGSLTIVDEELELVSHLAVLEMALAVEHKRFGSLVVLLLHKRHFHLVLDVLHAHAVAEAQVGHHGIDVGRVDRLID